jgi:hypothetical protein
MEERKFLYTWLKLNERFDVLFYSDLFKEKDIELKKSAKNEIRQCVRWEKSYPSLNNRRNDIFEHLAFIK